MSVRLEYKILSVSGDAGEVDGIDRLQDMVSRSLEEGWVPQGGVALSTTRGDFVFAQALTRPAARRAFL